MEEGIDNIFEEDFSLLIEAGFIATKQLDEISAIRLFEAAKALKPDSNSPQIGLGYIALNKMEIKEATRIFESVLEKEPDNIYASILLGITTLLVKDKRKKGEKMIKEAMEKTTESSIKDLGKIALLWSEKDLAKKDKAPFFAPKEKT